MPLQVQHGCSRTFVELQGGARVVRSLLFVVVWLCTCSAAQYLARQVLAQPLLLQCCAADWTLRHQIVELSLAESGHGSLQMQVVGVQVLL